MASPDDFMDARKPGPITCEERLLLAFALGAVGFWCAGRVEHVAELLDVGWVLSRLLSAAFMAALALVVVRRLAR